MIAITKASYDPGGAVIIKNYKAKSDIQNATARVSKSSTLDGGVVVIHSGFADGDRTINIKTRLSQTTADALWAMFTAETFINLAITDGVFSAVISSLSIDKGEVSAKLEIDSKLSE